MLYDRLYCGSMYIPRVFIFMQETEKILGVLKVKGQIFPPPLILIV